MKILDRYISRQFIGIVLFALLAFITLFVVVDLVEKMDNFIGSDVPKYIIGLYYLYTIPYYIVLTLPIAMLLASLFSLGNMARRNEIIVMKAAGMSLNRILLPVFIIAFLTSLGSLAFSEYVMPRATEKREIINNEYIEKDKQLWRTRIDNVYMKDPSGKQISILHFYASKNSGDKVSIKEFKGETLAKRIDARKMVWSDSVWILYDGYEREFVSDQEVAQPFSEKILTNFSLTPAELSKVLKKAEEMSFAELKEFIEKVKLNGGDTNRWMVDLYLKLSIPFASFIIVLFGAPLASHKRRGSAMTGFGISLAICFIYFGIVKTFQTLGHNGHISPFFAAWIANIIFGIGGIITLIKAPK